MVNLKNYEEYMLLYADGELNDAEVKELMKFVGKHPGLKEELKAYEATRLVPDVSVVYTGKEQLLKPVPGAKLIGLKQWRVYAAAAGIALLFLLGYRLLHKDRIEDITVPNEIVTNKAEEKPMTETGAAPVIENKSDQKTRQTSSPVAADKSVHSNPVIPVQEEVPVREPEKIVQVEVPKDEVPEKEEPVIAMTAVVPQKAETPAPEVTEKEFMSWAPIDAEKKEAIAMIKDEVNSKIEKLKTIKQNLKETDVVLKIGKKELFVLNF